MSHYLPNTDLQMKEMMATIGISAVGELFADVPENVRLGRPLDLPKGVSEPETIQRLKDLAERNISSQEVISFLGGGCYDHYIPAALDHLILRGDFSTAYTPYQAEISQGTLQAIYEFQSMMCCLTGMDQSNASMYEGGSALAEAISMALSQTGRQAAFMAESVHPEYRRVTESLIPKLGGKFGNLPSEDGLVDTSKLAEQIDERTAAVVVQYPNFFGRIEELDEISAIAKRVGALLIVVANPLALGMLTPPGDFGADIVCGEAQPLGIPMSYGGPFLGYLTARTALLRKMPGRITGCTVDNRQQRGFVLTLQAREQHIRREKATSNICSNQALMALCATIYLSLLGEHGLQTVARQCFQKAHYLRREMEKISGLVFPFSGSFFHEFVVRIPNSKKILSKLAKQGTFGGIALERWFPRLTDHVLVAVTEKRTVEEMNLYCQQLKGVLE